LSESVITEALAVQMAQPLPSNRKSSIVSPSRRMYTVMRSPHSGL
jgi:hypothetical protein